MRATVFYRIFLPDRPARPVWGVTIHKHVVKWELKLSAVELQACFERRATLKFVFGAVVDNIAFVTSNRAEMTQSRRHDDITSCKVVWHTNFFFYVAHNVLSISLLINDFSVICFSHRLGR